VLAAIRLDAIFTRTKPLVVTYAIENMSPFHGADRPRARTRLRRRVEASLARFVWGRVDRVAYGTDAARALYRATPALRRWFPHSPNHANATHPSHASPIGFSSSAPWETARGSPSFCERGHLFARAIRERT
jgi:hypothetical protein